MEPTPHTTSPLTVFGRTVLVLFTVLIFSFLGAKLALDYQAKLDEDVAAEETATTNLAVTTSGTSTSTEGWTLHTNADSGYSFYLPQDWVPLAALANGFESYVSADRKTAMDSTATYGPGPDYTEEATGISIQTYRTTDYFGNVSSASDLKEMLENTLYEDVRDTFVAGERAYSYRGGGCADECGLTYAFEYEERVYFINFWLKDGANMDTTGQNILDSFKLD